MTALVATAPSKFRQVREGNLNRFYTREIIGEILVDQFPNLNPKNIIDLGAGEGSLSSAAGKQWNHSEVVTVDIDPDSEAGLHSNIMKSGVGRHFHHVHDVFKADLVSALSQHGQFDLAVCNPPFFRPTWHEEFSQILKGADFTNAYQNAADVTSELLFLAQNIALLKDGGSLAIIAPDGMLTGWKTRALRSHLLANHRIESVLQLPRHSFHDTEARCFILFLTKRGTTNHKVKLLRLDESGEILEPIFIGVNEAIKRLDYDFHFQSIVKQDGHQITLRRLGADIKRGSISAATSKTVGYPTFHTSDFASLSDKSVSVASKVPFDDSRLVIAEAGDIIMARVDRALHQKIAFVESGRIALTDCVYRIRLSSEVSKTIFDAMKSEAGTTKILAATKGVGARLIGKADLLDIPFDVDSELSLYAKELF